MFEAWKHLGDFQPAWVVVMLVCETLSFACVWLLQAITLRCDDPFVITTTQLAGNAFNRVTPGGGATGTALQARMLADAGFELSYAGSALAMQSLLISAAVVAMPILAIPAIIAGTQVPGKLVAAVWVGAFVFVVMLGAGAVFMVTRRPVLPCRPPAAPVTSTVPPVMTSPSHLVLLGTDDCGTKWYQMSREGRCRQRTRRRCVSAS